MKYPSYYLGKPIESLQTMLREISNFYPAVLPVIPDGTFGRSTFASVRSFQTMQGLSPTGEVTPETWVSIAELYGHLYPKSTIVTAIPVWETNQILGLGSTNYHLFLVQAMLAALSYIFKDVQKTESTGKLDDTTQAGLQWLQQASGLNPTGKLDTQTWFYLTNLYRTSTGDGTTFSA